MVGQGRHKMQQHALSAITVADHAILATEALGSFFTPSSMILERWLCSEKNKSRDGKIKNILNS